MWRAARKIWGFLVLFFLIEWVIGIFFFHIISSFINNTSYFSWLLAIVIGLFIASIMTVLEKFILPKDDASLKSFGRPYTKRLLKFNFTLRSKFTWAIESCLQQDVYDCQQPNGWGLGVAPIEISRRIRILYEVCKIDIAEAHRDPSLLKYDVNHSSWEKLYLLVKHLGRKRLRAYLIAPPNSPASNWQGQERRRVIGTMNDREHTADSDLLRARIYDIEELRKIADHRKKES
jgi:hypothetical protein